MALKKKLNETNDRLRIERAKGQTIQVNKLIIQRRNAKWKKRLDIEFEKELYWGQKG